MKEYVPSESLKPFVKSFVIIQNDDLHPYVVMPQDGLVIGFQLKGKLIKIEGVDQKFLSPSGVSGMTDKFQVFKNAELTRSLLVYFTPLGFSGITAIPVNILFNQQVGLEDVFTRQIINDLEDVLMEANDDESCIKIVDEFLQTQLTHREQDRLIIEAVQRIYQSNGQVKMKDLAQQLFISQSPFEKRFRSIVGTTPKKFASIIRMQNVISEMETKKSIQEICYEHDFFDQAHFIKSFKKFSGSTPEGFKKVE